MLRSEGSDKENLYFLFWSTYERVLS